MSYKKTCHLPTVNASGVNSNYSLLLNIKVLKRNTLKQMTDRAWIDMTPQTMVQKYDHYKHFMDEFGSQVIGQTQFDVRCCERVPEQWLSAAGEAFGLLCIENYIEWADKEVQNSPTAEKHKMGKWNNNSNAARFEGIGAEGLSRYEELYEEVVKAREQDGRQKHAKEYLSYRKKLYENKQNGMKKRPVSQQATTSGKKLKINTNAVFVDY